jgi:dipeptidyl aminopeptidase/acylaminoacyl peptidase
MFAINAESATLGDDSLGGMESLTPEREMITLGRDGRTVVCARSGISTPPEVYCEDLTSRSKRIATGRITRLAQGFPLRDEVSVEDLNWKSTDKAFTIHGLLIRPARATTARHLPTVLCLGGDGMSPGMVHRRFRADGMGGAWLALAAQGYAVLVPNTRGRGGYGDAFLAGIRDGGSCIRLPFADAAAGLDHIISLAIADPDRLAVFGDGLGADIAAYALTRHQKFKAAVLHDLSRIHLVDKARVWPRNSWQWRRARDIFGIDDPEEFAQRSAILEQSALLQADRICTPTLIIGSMQSHFRAGAALNDCLARVNVPHATFLQLEDIGATRADKLTRSIEWLDFWVRGIEFPNATRAAEYNAWQIDGGWSS